MPFYSSMNKVNEFDHDGCHVEIFRREKGGFCCRLYHPIERVKCDKCGKAVKSQIVFQVKISDIPQHKLDLGDQTQTRRVAMALISLRTAAERDEELPDDDDDDDDDLIEIDFGDADDDDEPASPILFTNIPSFGDTPDQTKVPTVEEMVKWGWIDRALSIAKSSK